MSSSFEEYKRKKDLKKIQNNLQNLNSSLDTINRENNYKIKRVNLQNLRQSLNEGDVYNKFKKDIHTLKNYCYGEKCEQLEKDVDKVFNDINKCFNKHYTLSLEPIKGDDKVIPLKYIIDGNELTICYSFDEIFDDLYSRIKNEKLSYIPDMYYPSEKMNLFNKNIILSYDKKFNKSKLTALLSKQKFSLDMLSDMDKKFLQRLINNKDNISSFYNFIVWYIELPSGETKDMIDNFIVNTQDGKQVGFGIVLKKYLESKNEQCVKDFMYCLNQFISSFDNDDDKIETIEEEDTLDDD